MRGYFAIGVYNPKKEENIGTLWRSAYNFGAKFIFTIGKRYSKQASDTTRTFKHIPLFHFSDLEDFYNHIPKDCSVVCIEQCDTAINLENFKHPERVIYLLGSEDHGLPDEILCNYPVVFINTPHCLNVSVAGSIVMYDRMIKGRR